MRARVTGVIPRAILIVLAMTLALACGWDDSGSGGNPRPRGVTGVSRAQETSDSKPRSPAPDVPAAVEQIQPVDQAQAEPQDEEPERDYGGELRRAFGSPVGCLKPRTESEAPSEIAISLNATVMSGGNISRGYVSSAQLLPEEVDCLTTQLEGRRLPPEVEDAPRSVQTTITLQLKKPANSGG